MKRSRLRNIVNKAKELNTIKDPFDSFKNSLPIGLDYYKDGGKYRLKAAWEAYGKPKDFKEARWNGLIETFDGDSFIMPSIGYNAEKDSYEYLNIGKENEIVNKDLRAWDNDVIPFIKELKYGGYIKKFNEEEGYWSYVKEVSNPEEEIGSFKKGGKTEKESKNPDEMPIKAPSSQPSDLVKLIYNSNANFAKRLIDPYRKVLNLGEGKIGTHKLSYTTGDGKVYVYPEIQEINGELVDLSSDWRKAWEQAFKNKDYVEFPSVEDADWFTADNYKKYFPGLEKYAPQAFKQGGQMNVIPEGALHARKNGMELAKEGEVTHKGVPVVDNDGNQQAEIERNEIIFNKDTTDIIEKAYKEFYQEDTTKARQDELAIKIGKFLSKQILENTEDRTGLIEEVKEKML